MSFYTTQCPRCFTDYVISDQQYHAAEGMVRCGTCREHFKATILEEGHAEKAPKFDPREVFIEPLSESIEEVEPDTESGIETRSESANTLEQSDNIIIEVSQTSIDEERALDHDSQQLLEENSQPFEFMSTHEFEHSSSSSAQELEISYVNSDELSTSEILNNIRARQPENQADDDPHNAQEAHTQSSQTQFDLDLPIANQPFADQPRPTRQEPSMSETPLADKSLIDEVDKLVDEKLVNPALNNKYIAEPDLSLNTASSTTEDNDLKVAQGTTIEVRSEPSLTTDSADDFFLEPRAKAQARKGGFFRFIAALFKNLLWLIICITLLAGLAYQLWLKQIIELPENKVWFTTLKQQAEPFIERGEAELEKRNLALPLRRSLSQLKLVSAQVEPHPTRSSTVLLKVSVINKADISQPLPWLEMSLTNADGRLVARRNLSPKDYIYNNKTNSNIGANELKKISIELLSFPKSATGYEIKLLNN